MASHQEQTSNSVPEKTPASFNEVNNLLKLYPQPERKFKALDFHHQVGVQERTIDGEDIIRLIEKCDINVFSTIESRFWASIEQLPEYPGENRTVSHPRYGFTHASTSFQRELRFQLQTTYLCHKDYCSCNKFFIVWVHEMAIIFCRRCYENAIDDNLISQCLNYYTTEIWKIHDHVKGHWHCSKCGLETTNFTRCSIGEIPDYNEIVAIATTL